MTIVITRIFFKALYSGVIEVRAEDSTGRIYVVTNPEDHLIKIINSKGFSTYLGLRQQYERLTINP